MSDSLQDNIDKNSNSTASTDHGFSSKFSFTGISILIAVVMLSAGAWWWVVAWSRQQLINEEKGQIQDALYSYGRKLDVAISEKLALLEGMGAYVLSSSSGRELADDFETFASGMHTGDKSIRAFQIFPPSGPVLVYPRSGNEIVSTRTLHDLTNDTRQMVRKDVQTALLTRKMSTSGPYMLHQGVQGFIVRKAVFADEKLLAITTAVIDLSLFLESCGIPPQLPQDLSLALRDKQNSFIIGNKDVFEQEPIMYSVSWPDREWQLAAIPSRGWSGEIKPTMTAIKLTGLLIVILIASLSYTLSSRQRKAELLVKKKTIKLEQALTRHQDTVRLLEESENRYSQLFNISPDAIFLLDSKGMFLDCNEMALKFYGYDKKEICSMSAGDLAPRSMTKRVSEKIEMARKTEITFEWKHRRKDGSEFPVEIKAHPFHYLDNTYILASIRDISKQLAARESLRESEERFRTIFEAANVGKSITRITGELSVNRAFAEMLGYTPEELQSKTWQELTPDEDVPEFEALIRRMLKNKPSSAHFLKRYHHKDGSNVWCDVNTVLIRGKQGEPLYFITTLFDITARKNAEQALLQSERRYRALFENMTTGLVVFEVVTDDNGVPADLIILNGNKGFEEATGLIPQEVTGRRLSEVLPGIEKDKADWIQTYGEIALQGKSRQFELGSDLLGKFYSIIAYHSGPNQCAVTFVDISDRKRAEINLHELNLKLEERVAQRTAQLEEINAELESFTYSVSHDLRAPLRAVDGYTNILVEDYGQKLDNEGKRICSIISKSAREMGKLIDDLLALSRAGRTGLQMTAIDMKAVAQNIYSELATPNSDREVDFKVHALPTAYADPFLMRQVWINLLSNALKYTAKKANPVIEVFSENQNDQVVYAVRDNGIGFSMEYVDKLFGVFQRLHGTNEFEGTGVGLAIVHRIISRHKGRIWAEGIEGEGATFYFILEKGKTNELS